MKQEKEKAVKLKEPGIVIRPLGRLGGLDNIHVALAVVVALLFALLLFVSYSKPAVLTNSTAAPNCTYGSYNGTCEKPVHNSTQVKAEVERVLASYANVNNTLSLLPFISNVSSMDVSYLHGGEWLASVKASYAAGNAFTVSFLLNDSNLSRVTPLLQVTAPSVILSNQEVSTGVIKLGDKSACSTTSPVSAYWFIDPYAPGSIRGLLNATALEGRFGGRINVSINILFGQSTLGIGSTYGQGNAQMLGKYIFCASMQMNFSRFVSNLNSLYSGAYVSGSALSNLANASSLDRSALDSCIANSTQALNFQTLLASLYNITQTPAVITDCQYLSLPQTAGDALCYTNNTLC